MMRIPMVLALMVCLPACEEEGPTPAAPVEKAPEVAPARPTGDVLALVGDRPVVMRQFEAEVNKIPAQHRQWTATPQGRRHLVDNLVEGLVLESEAKQRGIDQQPEVVQKLEAYKRQVIRDALMQELTRDQAPLTDADVEKYFQDHPAEFRRPDRVKVLDLVVADEAAARDAMAKLKKGVDFAVLAKEVSTDPFTRERGGDLPEFGKEMRRELFEATVGKRLGEVIGPVQVGQSFHVLKLVNRLAAEEIPFEQAKDSLKLRLQAVRRQQAYIDFVKQAREKAKVQVNEEFITGKPAEGTTPAKQPAP